MPMILYREKVECSGCGACSDACGSNAITLKPDEYGFLFPNVDEDRCVNCGKCLKVCSLKQKELPVSRKECYVAASKREKEMLLSSSGGIFPIIAKEFIKHGGVVSGAVYDRNEQGLIYVRHTCAQNEDEIIPMQNSKYLQSFTCGIYQEVKKRLDSGRKVLFTGTPCQIAGLKAFLTKNYEGLFTIETICHGVPSARLFQDYVVCIEKRLNGKVESLCFRDKSKGWGKIPKITYKDSRGNIKSRVVQYYKSSYFMLFLRGDILRDSCYVCRFATERRAGDITLGDYWGVEWEHPGFLKVHGGVADYRKGVSCIIANTAKGSELVKMLGKNVYIEPSSYDKIAPHNLQILYPIPHGKNREKVLSAYLTLGYSELDKMAFKLYGAANRKARIRVAVTSAMKDMPIIKDVYDKLKIIHNVRHMQ